jgi:hypothetical protein
MHVACVPSPFIPFKARWLGTIRTGFYNVATLRPSHAVRLYTHPIVLTTVNVSLHSIIPAVFVGHSVYCVVQICLPVIKYRGQYASCSFCDRPWSQVFCVFLCLQPSSKSAGKSPEKDGRIITHS